MEKHFVKFFSAGTFVAEQTVKEIDSWDVDKAIEMSKEITERYGAKPYGFRFFTKGRTESDLDSKVVAQSGTYFINGVVETLEDIKAKRNPNNRILISNMECNGWDKVVTTYNPYKWTQPFETNDTIVTVES